MSKLVKFSDGTFGLRKGLWLFGYKFQDFRHTLFSWRMSSKYIDDCKTTKEKAISLQDKLSYKVLQDKLSYKVL